MTVKKKTTKKKTISATSRKRPSKRRERETSKHETPRKLAKFIEYFAKHGNKLRAANQAKISIRSINRHVKDDPAFAALHQEAYDVGTEIIHSEMFRRAVEGIKEPVYQGGKKVGTITKFSDGLLSKMASGRMKEIYGNNLVVQGDPDKPLAISDIGRDAALAEIAAIFAAAGLKPPVDTSPSVEGVNGGVASPAGAADARAGKPS